MKTNPIMDAEKVNKAIKKISADIKRYFGASGDFVLIGIVTRGVCLAERIAALLAAGKNPKLLVGSLDITFYRDDVGSISRQPLAKETRLPADITGRSVVLVDDVLFTGRSIRAALDELMDFGRPSSVHLAVLVDRGHRELPIQADFTGKKIHTEKDDDVIVNLKEIDGKDGVVITGKGKKG